MNSFKTLLSLSAIFAAGSQIARADTYFTMDTTQTFRQYSAKSVVFRDGSLSFELYDGDFTYRAGCGSTAQTNPDTGICVPGTNAYFNAVNGDDGQPVDGFGANRFQVVDSIEEALTVEPSMPQNVILRAVPASCTFRVSSEGFDDQSSVVIGTRVGSSTVTYLHQYNLTKYFYSKSYTASDLSTFDSDVRFNSNYQFDFPRLGTAITPSTSPIRLSVQHYKNVDGYRKVNNAYQGLLFTDLPSFVDGFIEVDPRATFVLRWTIAGSNPVLPSSDELHFSLLDLAASPNDPTIDTSTVYFPNFAQGDDVDTTDSTYVIMDNAAITAYSFPLGLFAVGKSVLANLTYVRELNLGTGAYDAGERSFQLPIKFVNSAAGGISVVFPQNSTDETLAFDADPDGDGYTNFEEWAQGSNPNSKSSVPSNGTISQSTSSSALSRAEGDTASTEWQISFNKVAYADSKVSYAVEVSENMKDWTEITGSNEYWTVTNELSSDKLIVTSKTGTAPAGSFFRMKISYAGE
ncbi:hypothetical protein JIN85_10945 [Luteolibacter pohnpeiensis]|uniref:F5/8 type C domain-containing protein n=1 Tax=Luteolibacter pohnpeiensis TaxID=454153 RepID=A0A934VR88_9BACT|nr:hypothetical protein [Luteolibacter pohnpeiensis]MBK1882936.1 hypothetical protein [Luteolibacter pohnpeiensis]